MVDALSVAMAARTGVATAALIVAATVTDAATVTA
jgi:hypothetical protein